MTTLVCSEALANADIEQDGIVWSKRFQEVVVLNLVEGETSATPV